MADYKADRSENKYSTSMTIQTACRIANRFRTRIPTVEELMENFGMSRATAFRWRAALREAKRAETIA
jgi:hypothetical protein